MTLKRGIICFAAVALISVVFQDPLFLQAIQNSADFFRGNIKDVWVFIKDRGVLTPWTELSLFGSFLLKNPQIVLIILLKTGFVFYQTVLSKERKWSLSDTSFAFLLFFFLFHPQQKPFFICALTPWFLFHFFTDPFFLKQRDRIYSTSFRKGFVVFLVIYGAVALSLKSSKSYRIYSNFGQKQLITQVSHFFQKFPSLRIYDPHAFLIHPHARHWFLGPYEAHKLRLPEYIQIHKIDVIFNSANTLLSLMLFEKSEKEMDFVNVQSHIYYRSLQIPLSPTKQFSGKFLLKNLEKKIITHFSKNRRLYWYMFLDEYQRPLITREPYGLCLTPSFSSRSKSLKQRCAYSRTHFVKGLTLLPPKEARFLAVFYVPPPQGISLLDSVKGLFIYDIFF